MSSDYYHGMVRLLDNFILIATLGLATASAEGAGFQSLELILNGEAGGS